MHDIIYIILAHKSPEQVKRLIRKLVSDDVYIYVHIDLNSSIADFAEANERVFFVENRVRCCWGDFSIIEATLNCIRKITKDKRHGHVILLSGQDYPIRSNDDIKKFFQKNENYDFIDCSSIKEAWPQKYIYRIQAYKLNFSTTRNDFIYLPTLFTLRPRGIFKNSLKLISKSLSEKNPSYLKLLGKMFIKKKIPKNIVFFGGSQWWALRTGTLEKIVEFTTKNMDFSLFFKDTLIPDELFFQTAIINALEEKVAEIKPKVVYLSWENTNDLSPKTFLMKDLAEIKAASTEKLFARKFDQNRDNEIMNQIDIMTSATPR